MIRGAHDGQNVIVTDYKEEDLEAIFQNFFKPEKLSDSSWKRKRFHKQDELFKGMSAMQHQYIYSIFTKNQLLHRIFFIKKYDYLPIK